MSRSSRRWLLAPVVVILAAVAGLAWFQGSYYPAMGLAGISRDGYRQAMERAVQSRARDDGRTFLRFDSMTFRPADQGQDAFAWGAARCRAADGATVFYWVSLRWSPQRGQWLRGRIRELAPAGSEIYFSRQIPGQAVRARLVLREILTGFWDRIREAWTDASAGAGLPRSGL